MKIIGIVGSNAEFSHNRLLLQFIEKKFSDIRVPEILEIKGQCSTKTKIRLRVSQYNHVQQINSLQMV